MSEIVDSRAGREPKGPKRTSTAGERDMARRSVGAATFAALAESGVMFLPVRLTAVQVIGATSGPLATYPAFVVLFVAGTALATRSRRWAGMPTAAAAAAFVVGVVQGLAASPSNLTAA